MVRTRSKGVPEEGREDLTINQEAGIEDQHRAEVRQDDVQQQINMLTAQVREMTQLLIEMKAAGTQSKHTQSDQENQLKEGLSVTTSKKAKKSRNSRNDQSTDERSSFESEMSDRGFGTALLPWSRRITEARLPSKLNLPKLELYDGTTDPEDHLAHYQNCMALQNGTSEAVMCRAFISSLKGPALAWFHNLPPRSVDSFSDLADRFVARFIASKRIRRDPSHLFNIGQKKGESLRQYVSRFISETSTVDGCDDQFVVTAMARGLKAGRLSDSMNKNPPATISAMMVKMQKYIKLEEYKAATLEEMKNIREESNKRGRNFEGGSQSRTRSDDRAKPSTEFTKSIDRIFREIRDRVDVRPPAAIRAPIESRDKSRYCEYHQDVGHNTEECRNLAWELERMAKEGKISEYIQQNERPSKVARIGFHERDDRQEHRSRSQHGDRSRHYEKQNREHESRKEDKGSSKAERHRESDKGDHNTIFVIHAETDRGGLSNSERKRKLHDLFVLSVSDDQTKTFTGNVVSFSDKDQHGLYYPHDDPLIISLSIGNFTIKRVLVDGGSSVNIIYAHAFDKMGIGRGQLKETSSVMSGFAGEKTSPVGMVQLPVRAGSDANARTVLTTFFVIESPSPYNVIMGRTWLHDMQAVASSFHQCVKFPVNGVQETIVGDQIAARQCLTVALKKA